MTITETFNEGWLFKRGQSEEYTENTCDDSLWERINLPHDWSIGLPPDKNSPTGGGGGYAIAGIGYYRKHFVLEDISDSERYYLCFDGIYMNSTVYVNGIKVGGCENGYSSFFVDITEHVERGGNVVAVKVDNSRQPNSRWYTGSGIYRNVWMRKTSAVHIDVWGVRCHTNGIFPEDDIASLQIRTFVRNDSHDEVLATVRHNLYDRENNQVSTSGTVICLQSGECGNCCVRPEISAPILWTDENPYLYTLETTVAVDGIQVDRALNRIGIRTAVFDADRGFLLNGRSVKIKGMCLHHDCGIVGAASYRRVWERRLKRLKDMGCNGIRCAHNIPAPEFLDLCDEMGFLVMDEAFDEWQLGKNKNDNYYSEGYSYGVNQSFYKNARENLETMIHRDYNHPGVILWSVGNEIPEQSSAEGVGMLKYLRDICHNEDCSRMVTSACDNIQSIPRWMTLREFENELDVVGYNYVGRWRKRAEIFYEEDRWEFPQRRMLGSENPSVGGIRGDYSGKGFWGDYCKVTLRNEALWRFTVSHDYVAGDYLWTGIDYYGETRWPNRGSSSGVLDTAGFKKDSFYYFRSIWNKKDITLHLLPHWNWQGHEGEFKQVVCYTNCDEVELYINGRLVGRKGYMCPRYGAEKMWYEGADKYSTTNDLHLTWDVPYESGILKACGYKNGEPVCESIVETTGHTSALSVEADEKACVGEPIHIEIAAVDEMGRIVPDEDMAVSCFVEGNARLLGMDAGNLADLTAMSESKRKMSAGMLLAMVIADRPGTIRVTFTAKENIKNTIEISVK